MVCFDRRESGRIERGEVAERLRPGAAHGAGGAGGHIAPAAHQQPVSDLRRQDLGLPLRHLLVRELQGLLQAHRAEQEELRLPARRRLSRHHRHAQKVPRLPLRKVSQHRHETRR